MEAKEEREERLCRLMALYKDGLMRVAMVYLRDAQLAEDAVQETFIRAYRAMDGFRGEASEKTWLTRIAVNTCKNMRREPWLRFAHRRVSLAAMPDVTPPREEADRALLEEIFSLPDREKDVVLMYYYQRMTVAEIAVALRISEPAVSKRLKRARERLRIELEGGMADG